ncbi:hypothetical protein Slin14017_G090630 [Septoria linicola]|nr:hypothetical protein Slin14017_G090630 [Septoria linicola]
MTPQSEGLDSSAPPTARDALQSNLESTLTLNRKKSWFGSAREAFHRGAKGVVDHLRSGDRKDSCAEDQENVDPEEDDGNSSGHNTGADNDSLTPLRRNHADKHKTTSPRGTISSLRQHIHTSGKSRGKRGALSEIMTAGALETHGSCEPATGATTDHVVRNEAQPDEKSPTKQHGRKSSVAKSMIGSLRSLSRRGTMSKPTSPTGDGGSPMSAAFAIPLPSSPIAIPAPSLKLNLGDAANISTSFLQRSAFDQRAELMAVTPPAIDQSMKLPIYCTRRLSENPDHTRSPSGRIEFQQKNPTGAVLDLPIDDFEVSLPHGPSTPVPGSDGQMEIDGTVDIFQEPPLFERSVEARDTPEKRDNKTLKKMISLDALAEQHIRDSPMRGFRLTPASSRKIRDISGTTVKTCPTDMPPLTRQLAALSTPSAGHRDPASGLWKSDDPFAPENAVSDIAANTATQPRITVHRADVALNADSPMSSTKSNSSFDNGSAQSSRMSDDDLRLGNLQARIIAARAVVDHAEQSNVMDSAHKIPSVQESLKMLQESTRAWSSQASSRLSSAQYDQFHPEHFLGLQECEHADPPPSIVDTEDQGSVQCSRGAENERPDVQHVHRCIDKPQIPSANTQHLRTDCAEDADDTFWKFSVQDWMHKRDHSVAPTESSSRRESIVDNCEVAGVRGTPPIGPEATNVECPPSMGDRLSFDLKRSNRNMRYNALTDTSNLSVAECGDGLGTRTPAFPLPARYYPMHDAEGFETRRDRGCSLHDFEAVFPASARLSPKKKTTSTQPQKIADCDPSSDGIEHELQEAITDHYVFQTALAGVEVTEYPELRGKAVDWRDCHVETGGHDQSAIVAGDECELPKSNEVNEEADEQQSLTPARAASLTHRVRGLVLNGQVQSGGFQDENSFKVLAATPTDDDSLENCLDWYKRYEACQGHFPSDHPSSEADFSLEAQRSVPATPQKRGAEHTSPGEALPAGTQSPTKSHRSPGRKTPARYRSSRSKIPMGVKPNNPDS